MNEQQFVEKCQNNGLLLTNDQLDQLEMFYNLLIETNKVMNLTAITEKEEVYEKHFYDSLLFSFKLDLLEKSLIDIGTGAGFPGLVIAICYPYCQVTLVEPLTKRCGFLKKVIENLNLQNVTLINARGEDLQQYREKFDYATARAVARLNILLEIITPLVKVNGLFIALKGSQGLQEIQEAEKALKVLKCEVIEIQNVNLITENDQRMNVFIRIKNSIDKKYPRNYAQIKKKPL